MRALLAALLLAALPAPAAAEEDCEGCKGHEAISRFPGYFLESATHNDFNAATFTGPGEKEMSKEGRYWRLAYHRNEGARAPSCVEVVRNYEAAFKKLGGKLVWKDDASCNATLSMPLGKSERWMGIGIYNGVDGIALEIVEVAAMEQKVEVSAAQMLEALQRDGFVALHDILFDTARDTIKPESAPLLAEVQKLLETNPTLKLSIEGHTDNVGNAKANQLLSQRRADSVKKQLGKGVGARLTTKGWGDSKPVADNRTEAGRAQNRRVELVKQ